MRKSSPSSIKEATVAHFSHCMRGIARIEGKTAFIQGAVPGEKVSFQYTRRKKDFDEGKVLAVLEPSPARVEPRCPHYALCGGCSLQHLSIDAQIQAKESILLELLERVAKTTPEKILPPLQEKVWHYRSKARLSVRFVEKKQSTCIGFRERHNPRYITDITQCPILHPALDAALPALRALMDTMEDKESIAQIEVAAGDEAIALIVRHLKPISENDKEKWRIFADSYSFKIFLQPGNADTVAPFYPEDFQWLSYRLPAQDLTFFFAPTDFTQVHLSLNQLMVQRALQMLELDPGDRVLDLFCGLGNFSLPIAQNAAQVTGIEGSTDMVERCFMNAQHNHIDNVQFFAANLDDPKAVSQYTHIVVDKILIDPPRTGALEIVKQIDAFKEAKRIVYISCNPITLARDAAILVHQKGYRLTAAGVMDMFVHTAHVESIAVFDRG